MGPIIIQVGARHGRMAELVKSRSESLFVGRGYNNDIVLNDPYVAAEQIVLRLENGQWLLEVLDYCNPVLVNGVVVTGAPVALNAGDKVMLGRTPLRIFSEDFPVENPRKLLFSHDLLHSAMRPLLAVVALLAACLLDVFSDYQQQLSVFDWKIYASSALVLAFVIICWSGFWGVVGRLLRHQHHFSHQLLVSSTMVALIFVVYPLGAYIGYGFDSDITARVLETLLVLLLLTALLRFNLFFATNLKHHTGIAFVISCSAAIFIYVLINFNQEAFSTSPEYSQLLKPPFAKWNSDLSIDQYLQDVEATLSDLSVDVSAAREEG